MHDERPKDIVRALVSHPPIPTDQLRQKLIAAAIVHEDGVDEPGMIEVSSCILISLLHELIRYRDRYGYIALPDEEWEFKKD